MPAYVISFTWPCERGRPSTGAAAESIKTYQLKDSAGKHPFTSRSFFLSSSLSAMRCLLSSSSFRASLVSVRNLSSFRILRIFLRPLRSSPSCCSSSSSPLCGNYTSSSALWSSALREGKKKLSMINSALNNLQKRLQGWVQTTFCLPCGTWKVLYVDSTLSPRLREKNFLECARLLPSVEHFKHLLVAGRGFLNFNSAPLLLLLVTSLLLLILFGRSSTDRQTWLKLAGG